MTQSLAKLCANSTVLKGGRGPLGKDFLWVILNPLPHYPNPIPLPWEKLCCSPKIVIPLCQGFLTWFVCSNFLRKKCPRKAGLLNPGPTNCLATVKPLDDMTHFVHVCNFLIIKRSYNSWMLKSQSFKLPEKVLQGLLAYYGQKPKQEDKWPASSHLKTFEQPWIYIWAF